MRQKVVSGDPSIHPGIAVDGMDTANHTGLDYTVPCRRSLLLLLSMCPAMRRRVEGFPTSETVTRVVAG